MVLLLLRRCCQHSCAVIACSRQEALHPVSTWIRSLSRAARSTSGVGRESCTLGEDEFAFESGALAQLADGAAVAQHGNTVVLTTVVSSRELDAARDFLPLQVDYRESMSAAGRIPEVRVRRESATSERETLCGRAIDRAIRPLFPPNFFYDTHIHSTVLAADGARDPELVAINAASAALMCSDVPWGGPVGAVQVACVGGDILLHPTRQQAKEAALKLTLAGTANRTVMIEAAGNQVPEEVVANAIRMAQGEVVKLVEAQQKLAKRKGRPKRQVELMAPSAHHVKLVKELVHVRLQQLFETQDTGKAALGSALEGMRADLLEELRAQGRIVEGQTVLDGASDPSHMTVTQAAMAFEEVQKSVVRSLTLDKATRVGGRQLTEIRPITCTAGVLPSCVHGSALFQRGETQSLCSATVASERERVEGLNLLGPYKRYFLLHYNFPPAAVNEVGKLSQPSRREIGHGALAEKALAPLMPSQEDFPFVVRVVADTLMSNGSSSMAAVCGGSLALKDAGVPISSLAAGISVGLVTEKGVDSHTTSIPAAAAGHTHRWPKDFGRHALLTDIQGIEDHLGEMDFKVAGTRVGITAIQLDVKLPGVPHEWLIEALQPAKTARQQLLTLLEEAAERAQPADKMECPMVGSTSINKELLTRLIGLDGENVLRLEEESGAKVVVDESGVVEMYAPTQWQFHKAESLVKEVEGASIKEGQLYSVKVVSVHDFGAMVELPNGVQSLLHINELSHFKIRDIQDVVTVGTELVVKCIGRDEKGLIKLSRKAAMPKTSQDGTGSSASASSRHSSRHASAHADALEAARAFAAKTTKPLHPPPGHPTPSHSTNGPIPTAQDLDSHSISNGDQGTASSSSRSTPTLPTATSDVAGVDSKQERAGQKSKQILSMPAGKNSQAHTGTKVMDSTGGAVLHEAGSRQGRVFSNGERHGGRRMQTWRESGVVDGGKLQASGSLTGATHGAESIPGTQEAVTQLGQGQSWGTGESSTAGGAAHSNTGVADNPSRFEVPDLSEWEFQEEVSAPSQSQAAADCLPNQNKSKSRGSRTTVLEEYMRGYRSTNQGEQGEASHGKTRPAGKTERSAS